MGMDLLLAQSLKSVWVGQHLTPLLGQGGEATGDLLLLSHADCKHLPGFLPGWCTSQGGQAQRHAIGILNLAYPVLLGQPEKGFDRIGTERQADVGETERRGGLELVLEIARKLAAHGCGRDRVDQGLALRERVVREALRFENLLAGQQRDRIVSEALDQRFARG